MPEAKISKNSYISIGLTTLLIVVAMYIATLKADVKNNGQAIGELKTEITSLRNAIIERNLTFNE